MTHPPAYFRRQAALSRQQAREERDSHTRAALIELALEFETWALQAEWLTPGPSRRAAP